jgi:hypothetical protein
MRPAARTILARAALALGLLAVVAAALNLAPRSYEHAIGVVAFLTAWGAVKRLIHGPTD